MTFKTIRDFTWEDLNEKFVKIAVVDLNPESPGQVWAIDRDLNAYLLDEWYTEEEE